MYMGNFLSKIFLSFYLIINLCLPRLSHAMDQNGFSQAKPDGHSQVSFLAPVNYGTPIIQVFLVPIVLPPEWLNKPTRKKILEETNESKNNSDQVRKKLGNNDKQLPEKTKKRKYESANYPKRKKPRTIDNQVSKKAERNCEPRKKYHLRERPRTVDKDRVTKIKEKCTLVDIYDDAGNSPYQYGHYYRNLGYYNLALRDFNKSIKKDQDPRAFYMVAWMLENNEGQNDLIKARDYYFKAAQAGSPDAQFQLGLYYHNGNDKLDLKKDIEKAKQFYSAAREGGHVLAIVNLGIIYEEIEGDHAMAFKYFKEASKHGSFLGKYRLAHYYKTKMEMPVVGFNLEEAEELLNEAADKVGEAALELGQLYWEKGFYNDAFEAFEKGSAQDDIECHFHVAKCYRDGDGTSRNLEKARIYFEKAALAGHEQAKKALENWPK